MSMQQQLVVEVCPERIQTMAFGFAFGFVLYLEGQGVYRLRAPINVVMQKRRWNFRRDVMNKSSKQTNRVRSLRVKKTFDP